MKSIRLKNYRSFIDTDEIEIKPITAFLGINSSGKSSILRAFPLVKQSCLQKIEGPLLWFGQYIDFGSFEETLSKKSSEDFLQLSFDFGDMNIKNEISCIIKKNEDFEYVSKIIIKNFDHIIEIDLLDDSQVRLKINNLELGSSNLKYDFDINKIGPIVYSNDSSSELRNYAQFLLIGGKYMILQPLLMTNLLDYIKEAGLNKRITDRKILEMVSEINIDNRDKMIDQLYSCGNGLKSWKSFLNRLQMDTEKLDRLIALLIATNLTNLTIRLSSKITEYFTNSYYLAPLRASAERYYRIANYAIEEVDHSGLNLAMFLKSLDSNEIAKFQDWTMNYFNFKVAITPDNGHVSINIITDDDHEVNLTDTGFGYSQILPIITQLWVLASIKKGKNKKKETITEKTIIIEQPELHLHPNMQFELVKAFIAAIQLAKQNDILLNIIIETHSKTIIDSLGSAVEKSIISLDDVGINIVEKKHGISTIKKSCFDEYGILKNWPFGFFETKEF